MSETDVNGSHGRHYIFRHGLVSGAKERHDYSNGCFAGLRVDAGPTGDESTMPRSDGYVGIAATNADSFRVSRRPSVRTPLHTSMPNGSTVSMASWTLSARRPPARYTGIESCWRMDRLICQLCDLPVPPSCFTDRCVELDTTGDAMGFKVHLVHLLCSFRGICQHRLLPHFTVSGDQ